MAERKAATQNVVESLPRREDDIKKQKQGLKYLELHMECWSGALYIWPRSVGRYYILLYIN